MMKARVNGNSARRFILSVSLWSGVMLIGFKQFLANFKLWKMTSITSNQLRLHAASCRVAPSNMDPVST